MLKAPPVVSLVVFIDAEKDRGLLKTTLQALWDWNREGLDQTQVVLVKQHAEDKKPIQIAANLRYHVDVVNADHETVDGYPLWDIFGTMNRLRGWLRGEYLMMHHPEFLLYPGRLKKCIDFLAAEKPHVAMGNLRRLGPRSKIGGKFTDWAFEHVTDQHSGKLITEIQNGRGQQCIEGIETTTWCYWLDGDPPEGYTGFSEDVYFVRQDFLDTVRFWHHAQPQLFQDIYDVFWRICQIMEEAKMQPKCYRLPMSTHKAAHLWHPKVWDSWTPKVRDWCYANADRLRGTCFTDRALWDELLAVAKDLWYTDAPVIKTRRGPLGSVTRYDEAFRAWLKTHRRQLAAYYENHQPRTFHADSVLTAV